MTASNIPPLTRSNVLRALKPYKGTPLPTVNKTAQMHEIEQAFGGHDIRLIFKVIYELTGLQVEIARLCNIKQATVSKWADMLGVELITKPLARINAIKTEEIELPVAA